MTKMFIANCSKHDHAFLYQLPENPATLLQDIITGQQVMIAKDLSLHDVDAIVRHHARYGMIHVDQVGKVRNRVSPLVYSLGKSVPLQKMLDQIQINEAVLVEQGKESRVAAAIQSNDFIERTAREMRLPDRVVGMDFEIMEETRDTKTDASPEIAEGIRIDRNAPSDLKPSRARRSRARQRA